MIMKFTELFNWITFVEELSVPENGFFHWWSVGCSLSDNIVTFWCNENITGEMISNWDIST